MGVMKPELVMKSIIPVVMAGVLGIYGLIIAVIIANGGAHKQTPLRPLPVPSSCHVALRSCSCVFSTFTWQFPRPFRMASRNTLPSPASRTLLPALRAVLAVWQPELRLALLVTRAYVQVPSKPSCTSAWC